MKAIANFQQLNFSTLIVAQKQNFHELHTRLLLPTPIILGYLPFLKILRLAHFSVRIALLLSKLGIVHLGSK